jgi:hypothetical protein
MPLVFVLRFSGTCMRRISRPLMQVHGAAGVHPLVKIVLETARMAAFHGAQLGLDPASAKRIGVSRGRGRPIGAVSAPDRLALPPLQLLERPRARWKDEPPRMTRAVNRARGHQVVD